ncbi:hypothetical protein EHJ11_06880 [Cronobacter turicensis]|nr:hypothetical protein [Cronobacter turicensis]NCH22467.1 hypothetical protein [Cronobacter turicensis]NCH62564.1 hypothetical protein [Cronobacter turicensis]
MTPDAPSDNRYEYSARNAGGLRSEVGYHPTAGKSLHRHFCKTISERRLAAGNIWQRRITVSPVVSMPEPQSVQRASAEGRHGARLFNVCNCVKPS